MADFGDDHDASGGAQAIARRIDASNDAANNVAGASTSSSSSRQRKFSPEPDEHLDMADGRLSMWLLKCPRFLIDAWSHVQHKDQQLGLVRVYNPDANGHQRMELILHDAEGRSRPVPLPADAVADFPPHLAGIPRRYDLRMLSHNVAAHGARNLYAFKEMVEGDDDDDDDNDDDDDDDDGEDGGEGTNDEKDDGDHDEARDARRKRKGKQKASARGPWSMRPPKKGRREVALAGTITSELSAAPQVSAPKTSANGAEVDVKLSLADRKKSSTSGASSSSTPLVSEEYREILRRRRLEASKPKRSVKMLDDADMGKRNMLAAGVGLGFVRGKNTTLVASKAKATTEKFTRMPRNELLDVLFSAFDRYPYWSLRGLREHTQQPEAYLREVLTDVADLHRRGPYTGHWSLKPGYLSARQAQASASAAAAAAAADPGAAMMAGASAPNAYLTGGAGPGSAGPQTAGADGAGGASRAAGGGGGGGGDAEDDDEEGEDFDEVAL